MIIDMHRDILPSFGLIRYQAPLSIYTLLCLGGSGRDCAAYRGICPDLSTADEAVKSAMLNEIRRGGHKISEDEARSMFNLVHEGQSLAYRR